MEEPEEEYGGLLDTEDMLEVPAPMLDEDDGSIELDMDELW